MGVSLRTETTVVDGITLVACRIVNETRHARGVRVRNRLDGPTLPPRRRGRPVTGWNEDSYAAVVAPADRVAFGYASPVAAPADPPAVVASVGEPAAVADDGSVGGPTGAPQPPSIDTAGSSDGSDASAGRGRRLDEPQQRSTDTTGEADTPRLPAPVAAYLAGARGRAAAAHRLNGSLDEARATLAERGVDPVTLDDRLDREAARLRVLAGRAERLAERCAAAEVPTEAIRRLR